MTDVEKQEGQKTVVAFIAGLLIGGLLVWVFSADAPVEPTTGSSDEEAMEAQNGTEEETVDTPATSENTGVDENTAEVSDITPVTMNTGDGAIEVNNQPAGDMVNVASAEFPTTDGWIAVRDYTNDTVGAILGAARYSQSQGLIPESVELLRNTEAGNTYAVVFFTEDGARNADGRLYFDPAGDQQIDGVMTTFTAQ